MGLTLIKVAVSPQDRMRLDITSFRAVDRISLNVLFKFSDIWLFSSFASRRPGRIILSFFQSHIAMNRQLVGERLTNSF